MSPESGETGPFPNLDGLVPATSDRAFSEVAICRSL